MKCEVSSSLGFGVVARGGHLGRDGHSDAAAETLAERTGGGLDSRGSIPCSGWPGVRLPHCRNDFRSSIVTSAGQGQHRIEQHRSVAGGEHEAIAVRPGGILRVVAEKLGPQDQCGVGHPHREAGVAGVGLLHAVGGEHSDHVGGQGHQFRVGHRFFLFVDVLHSEEKGSWLERYSFDRGCQGSRSKNRPAILRYLPHSRIRRPPTRRRGPGRCCWVAGGRARLRGSSTSGLHGQIDGSPGTGGRSRRGRPAWVGPTGGSAASGGHGAAGAGRGGAGGVGGERS